MHKFADVQCTDLGIQNFLPLRGQIVFDTTDGSFKSDSSDEENGQHHIREGRCEIHYLMKDITLKLRKKNMPKIECMVSSVV